GRGTAAVARSGVFARRGSDPRRLLPAAEHLFFRAQSRGPDDVPEVPGRAGLARTDGGIADCAAAAQGNRGSAADRACQEVARIAPAEILIFVRETGELQTPRQRTRLQALPLGGPRPSPSLPLFRCRRCSPLTMPFRSLCDGRLDLSLLCAARRAVDQPKRLPP